MAYQAVFLDRDGTLNRERSDYVKSWAEYAWLPGALPALAQLATLAIPIIVVTNQSGIGRGLFTPETLEAIHQRVRADAEAGGGRIDRFLYCPHTPAEQCGCRKPQPGLFLQAAAEYGLDLNRCVLIGDTLTDYRAAAAIGCASIIVRTGNQGAEIDGLLANCPQVQIVDDLTAAVAVILAAEALHSEAVGK